MTQQLAWRGPSALTIFEGCFSIDHDRAITFSALDAPPFAAGEIVNDFSDPVRGNLQLVQIVNDDIRCSSLAENSTISKARGKGRQRGETIMRFLEGDALLVANQPSQEIGGVRAADQELGMGAAVRNAREGVHRVVDQFAIVLAIETGIGNDELNLQISGDREVE